MQQNKILSLLGLAEKSRNITSGEFSTEKSVKENQAYFVIVAEDASDNTKKKFRNMCEFYKVPMAVYGTKDEIGHSIGKEFRATVAIVNEGFANEISKILSGL